MSCQKKFKLGSGQIKQLIDPIGGCFATDHITVQGMSVGYMYREASDNDSDSGWRFFSGKETQAYVDNPENTMMYDVNTIANYDPAIIPFLDAQVGAAFGRVPGTDEFRHEILDDGESNV